MLNGLTFAACAVVIFAFVWAWRYVVRTDSTRFAQRREWIEQLPSVIQTLGVLGTFLGITVGLLGFDTANLDVSIPALLAGLKTAFFTSLLGMAGSLVLARMVSRRCKADTTESEAVQAARLLIDHIRQERKAAAQETEETKELLRKVAEGVQQINTNLTELTNMLDERLLGEDVFETLEAISDKLDNLPSPHAKALQRIEALALTAAEDVASIAGDLPQIRDDLAKIREKADL